MAAAAHENLGRVASRASAVAARDVGPVAAAAASNARRASFAALAALQVISLLPVMFEYVGGMRAWAFAPALSIVLVWAGLRRTAAGPLSAAVAAGAYTLCIAHARTHPPLPTSLACARTTRGERRRSAAGDSDEDARAHAVRLARCEAWARARLARARALSLIHI